MLTSICFRQDQYALGLDCLWKVTNYWINPLKKIRRTDWAFGPCYAANYVVILHNVSLQQPYSRIWLCSRGSNSARIWYSGRESMHRLHLPLVLAATNCSNMKMMNNAQDYPWADHRHEIEIQQPMSTFFFFTNITHELIMFFCAND